VQTQSLGVYLQRLELLADWKFWAAKCSEFRLLLQRSFWTPLRNAMEIFHPLPLVAVAIIFVLFATDGQFREIYISYLEGPKDSFATWVVSIGAALVAIALISAVLYQAHNALSTMRINIVFSNRSGAEAESKLPQLQRAAAFTLAFAPWFGLTVGLFNAQNFITARYCQLFNVANVATSKLQQMMHALPSADGLQIAAAVMFLGIVTAAFVSIDDRNRSPQWAVVFAAPALAIFLFLLFADWPSRDSWKSWTAWIYVSAAIGVAIVIYFVGYYRLYHRRGGSWLTRPFVRTGVGFSKRRRRRLALWALLPWVAFALYFSLVKIFVPGVAEANSCLTPQGSALAVLGPGRWAIFPIAMCCTIAIGLLVSHFLLLLGSSKAPRIALRLTVCGLALAVAVLSVFNDSSLIVETYRFIGPLATVSLELLFLLATFAVLAVLSQHSGFPVLTLVVLTMIICVMFPNYAGLTVLALGLAYFSFAIVALVSGRFVACLVLLLLTLVGWINFNKSKSELYATQNVPHETVATTTPQPTQVLDVQTAYLCWLDQKGIPANRTDQQISCGDRPPKQQQAHTGKYPVFIFAVEGGGIYAASAAAAFLAELEDQEQDISKHIFAISGVSGGSIGAAVFQALDHARHPDPDLATGASKGEGPGTSPDETCTLQTAPNTQRDIRASVSSIMLDDHFSPVVGSIFPEIFKASLKRPDALGASFEYSTSAQNEAAGRDLCAHFLDHWKPRSTAPALVLNSTWVETGFRAAFAPFYLHSLDESLYSFVDTGMPDEACPTAGSAQTCISLMTAAGVSARFPGLMPPFSVELPAYVASGGKGTKPEFFTPDPSHQKRWNFVDGGYADNSGATTALDIYLALKEVLADDIDLRMVLITSAVPQPVLFDASINGTLFRDIMAPIDAMLKVREDLGNDAVAGACSTIYGHQGNKDCLLHAGASSKESSLQIVEIQDQTYGLPLGWKISRNSFEVVSWMLGAWMLRESGACKNTAAENGEGQAQSDDTSNAQLTGAIVLRNCEVSKLLVNSVRNYRNSSAQR
jgi:hypothetical protein